MRGIQGKWTAFCAAETNFEVSCLCFKGSWSWWRSQPEKSLLSKYLSSSLQWGIIYFLDSWDMGTAVGLQRIKEMLLHIQQKNSLSNSNQSYPFMRFQLMQTMWQSRGSRWEQWNPLGMDEAHSISWMKFCSDWFLDGTHSYPSSAATLLWHDIAILCCNDFDTMIVIMRIIMEWVLLFMCFLVNIAPMVLSSSTSLQWWRWNQNWVSSSTMVLMNTYFFKLDMQFKAHWHSSYLKILMALDKIYMYTPK